MRVLCRGLEDGTGGGGPNLEYVLGLGLGGVRSLTGWFRKCSCLIIGRVDHSDLNRPVITDPARETPCFILPRRQPLLNESFLR